MKATQQNILHYRVQAHLYQGLMEQADLGEMKSLMQQSWVMMLVFYKKLEKERKEQSLPGSVPPVEGQLFGKEELQAANMTSRLNGFKKTPHSMLTLPLVGTPQATGLGTYSFRTSGFQHGFRGGFKGQGKSRFGQHGAATGYIQHGAERNKHGAAKGYNTGYSTSSASSWRGRSHGGKGRGRARGLLCTPYLKGPFNISFSQAERMPELVEAACHQRSLQLDTRGSGTPVPCPVPKHPTQRCTNSGTTTSCPDCGSGVCVSRGSHRGGHCRAE